MNQKKSMPQNSYTISNEFMITSKQQPNFLIFVPNCKEYLMKASKISYKIM